MKKKSKNILGIKSEQLEQQFNQNEEIDELFHNFDFKLDSEAKITSENSYSDLIQQLLSDVKALKNTNNSDKLEADKDSLSIYLKQISKIPLLTKEEELTLGKNISSLSEEAVLLKKKLLRKRKNRDEMEVFLKSIESRIEQEKSKLITSNLRLVVSIAKRYQSEGLQLLDIINEGNIGLIEAVDRFDYRKGYRFSTYGTWWIKQSIAKAIADKGRTIRIPLHMLNSIKKCYKISKKLLNKLGRNPSIEEIALEMKIAPSKVLQIVKLSLSTSSLETPIEEGSDTELISTIEDDKNIADRPLDRVFNIALNTMIKQLLQKLSTKERKVLELRFGLNGALPLTLEKTGKKLGITRERARQIQERALTKLKKFKVTRELKSFILSD